jgi:hypothetical protein
MDAPSVDTLSFWQVVVVAVVSSGIGAAASRVAGAGALATGYTGHHQGDCTVIPTEGVRNCG